MDYPARIMIIGNGGRECAIANALLLSRRVEQLFITPPNWGLLDPYQSSGRVTALSIGATDTAALVQAAAAQRVQLAVVGPEAPLVAGLADELRAAGIPTIGPGKEAARLEGSKVFAKEFMKRYEIPTADYMAFDEPRQLRRYLDRTDPPLVLKADGLAAGKGVIVCKTREEVDEAYARIAERREFGDAGDTVVVEELLEGPEISFTCLVAGDGIQLLEASSDYKRLMDRDAGPNTGGMGNIAPSPWAPEPLIQEFMREPLARIHGGILVEKMDYRGYLFVGTMLTKQGLKVLEFNVRLGDPEAQVVLPLQRADWPRLLLGVAQANGKPWGSIAEHLPGACVAVVLASANYPYGQSEPALIEGLDRVRDRGLLAPQLDSAGNALPPPVSIYFSGVEREPIGTQSDEPYTNYTDCLERWRYLASGGRVLAVSALGRDLSEARRIAYEVVGNLRFNGMQYRGDIGKLK